MITIINSFIDSFNENRYVKLLSTIGVSGIVLYNLLKDMILNIVQNQGLEIGKILLHGIPDILLWLLILMLLFSVAYVRKENKKIKAVIMAVHLLDNNRFKKVREGKDPFGGDNKKILEERLKNNPDTKHLSEAERNEIMDAFFTEGGKKFD